MYVANSGANTVEVVSTATNAVTTTIPVGNFLFGIAFQNVTVPSGTDRCAHRSDQCTDRGRHAHANQGSGLIDKLNQVITKLANDQTGAACNQLSAFISQVQAFMNSHALSQSQGQSLIDAANAVKTNLGC